MSPYNGVPSSMTPAMDRCKEKVMSQGHDESSAIAICHASIVGKEEDAMKVTSAAGFSLTDDELEEMKAFAAKLEAYSVHGAKAETYGGVPRSQLKDSDFVFPDERAFPIKIPQDVEDAVNSWGRYRGPKSFDDFKRRLTALAKRKGLESALPEKWKSDGGGMKLQFKAVKVAGDWELDVLAIPFAMDDEGQYFDANTDIMPGQFNMPAVMYQHSLKSGGEEILRKGLNPFDEKPVPIGEPVPGSLHKEADGWHIRVILDKTKAFARKVMEAARKGLVAVSSGTVEHMARLVVKGQTIPYTKQESGYISVWPFAEISLWDLSEGNFRPASRIAYAVPAMKAIYRDAGLEFPFETMSAQASAEARRELEQLHKQSDDIERFIKLRK